MTKIGKITFNIPNGDNFFGIHEGKFNKKLKVKVGICESKHVNEKEIESLNKLNSNEHVQKLYYHKFSANMCYLALEWFNVTLDEYMINSLKIDAVKIISNITDGCKYLHDMQIAHGNINCRNIGIFMNRKCAKILIGYADSQKGVALILTQRSVDESLIKKDLRDLSEVIFCVLINTMNGNTKEFVEYFKKEDRPYIMDFFNKCNEFYTELSFKDSLKLFLIWQILTKGSGLSCKEIRKSPLFWSNKMKYMKLKEIAEQWENEIVENIEYIDKMGDGLLKNFKWTNKLLKNCLNAKKCADKLKMSSLVKRVVSKIKYYQQTEFNQPLQQEHMLYFIEKFPFLLPFMIAITDDICTKNSMKCGYLYEKFLKNDLPLNFLISSENVIKGELIKKSNAEVYSGEFNRSHVALKRISKNYFKINEIKSIIKLKSRPTTDQMCKVCNKKESCENVIEFYGCYATDEFVWMVMEKAKEDFKDYVFPNQEIKLQILLDAVKGLECLHANSICHLDIKPGNILVVERNSKLVGCLADFGESIDAIKKTYNRSKLRGTDGYIAPELEEAFRHHRKSKTKAAEKGIALNYSKCDIYSLGMVLKSDYLDNLNRTEFTDVNIKVLEKLIDSMTQKEPAYRPDAEEVRKNPVFWDTSKKIKFLEYVHGYGESHSTDPAMKESFENMIIFRKNWVGSLKSNDEVNQEIQKFFKNTKKDLNHSAESIFELVELILFIRSKDAEISFKETRKKLNANNDKTYFDFWFNNFEIPLLYYHMHDVLKYKREFYSIDQPKRHFLELQKIKPVEANIPLLFYTPSTSTLMWPEFINPEIRDFLSKIILELIRGTANTRTLRRIIRKINSRQIENRND